MGYYSKYINYLTKLNIKTPNNPIKIYVEDLDIFAEIYRWPTST